MERKSITNTAKFIISTWNIGLFIAVWVAFYNAYAFDFYHLYGGLASSVIYLIIYLALCNLYKAFRIASTNLGEVIFAQVISFGIADLILYAECCLINNHIVNLIPGIITVFLQGIGTIIIVIITKRYFIKHVKPKLTYLLYGDRMTEEETSRFAERLLKKYRHLFDIAFISPESVAREEFLDTLSQCEVVILYEISSANRGEYLKLCMEAQKKFYFTPEIEDLICQGSSYKHLLDTPLMKYDYSYEGKKEYGIKRVLDLLLSVILLILLSPVFLITALCIRIEDGGPVFYRQERYTKNGRIFRIIKFRSMVVDAEKNGAKPCVGNDSRITKVGRVIRRSRIDELPQLFNILKGDMSFVGPRPERVEHVKQYTTEMPEFAYRLRVKGGLTGYAQIYGKYNTSAYDKLRLDLMYIENQSLLTDLKIMMLTFRTIFQPDSTEGFEEDKSASINQKAQTEQGDGNQTFDTANSIAKL